MNRLKKVILFMVVALLMYGCAPLDDQKPKVSSEFQSMCNAIAKSGGGKITREEFMAAAKDKEQAAIVYQLCDPTNKGHITEEDVSDPQKMRMMQEVIRMTEPRGMR